MLVITLNGCDILCACLRHDLHMTKLRLFVEGAPGCGGSFESATGVVISPNYPNPYPRLAQCVWTIRVLDGERITINFTQVDLEDHQNCIWDHVEVRRRCIESRETA